MAAAHSPPRIHFVRWLTCAPAPAGAGSDRDAGAVLPLSASSSRARPAAGSAATGPRLLSVCEPTRRASKSVRALTIEHDPPKPIEVTHHRVAVREMTVRNLEHLVSAVTQLFPDLAVAPLRRRTPMKVA